MGKGYSLHIGLNAVDPAGYNGWAGKLNACENDANDMAAIAGQQKYAHTEVLLTADATATNVLTAMLDYARKLEQGDFLLLTYSGHGGQVPDETNEEDDGYDETWCLYDRQIIDDELYGLFGKFAAGVRIFMLSDSCHSGSVARAIKMTAAMRGRSFKAVTLAEPDDGARRAEGEPASRLAPLEITLAAYEAHRDLYLALKAASPGSAESVPPKAGVVLISGCQDDQESLDGRLNGLFTGIVKRVWNDGKFAGGYRLFHKTIVGRMPASQKPNLFTVGKIGPAFVNKKPFVV